MTWQPAYRLLLLWVYDRTRSLPVVMIMAASLVTFWTSLTPMELSRTALAVFYLALAAVWCAVAAVVALTNHGRLTRQPSLRERVA